MITNYHQHSHFSDGNGALEEYVQAGLRAGLAAMGFTDHAPVPFFTEWTMPVTRLPEYRSEIRRLQRVFGDRIELSMGLEMDYLPEADVIAFQKEKVLALGWDYVIGSIHYLGHEPDGQYWSVDVGRETLERGLQTIYGGDVRRYCDHYYATARDLARDGRFTIMGHFDYTKRFNDHGRYYSDEATWYRQMIDETLRVFAAQDIILEVNSGGWRSPCRSAYPAPFILRRACELGIRVTLDSDAHRPWQVAYGLSRALDRVRRAGYTQVARLLGGQWRLVPLAGMEEDRAAGLPDPAHDGAAPGSAQGGNSLRSTPCA
jgi:histidinol-phosphatase (PHP family)